MSPLAAPTQPSSSTRFGVKGQVGHIGRHQISVKLRWSTSSPVQRVISMEFVDVCVMFPLSQRVSRLQVAVPVVPAGPVHYESVQLGVSHDAVREGPTAVPAPGAESCSLPAGLARPGRATGPAPLPGREYLRTCWLSGGDSSGTHQTSTPTPHLHQTLRTNGAWCKDPGDSPPAIQTPSWVLMIVSQRAPTLTIFSLFLKKTFTNLLNSAP